MLERGDIESHVVVKQEKKSINDIFRLIISLQTTRNEGKYVSLGIVSK